ncbi:MAG TPA: MraY family glycosyltransferase [Rhizomicrobium sp.]|jgi:UDP-GlcNAc:undecaprenyl-phosphate GlcNAc-1-phosphate transferase|nr:MraY family glycosyltransferase [Rhizomicrobium sp.]
MLFQLLSFTAILITLVVCLSAAPLGRHLGVMAIPDGRRKTHSSATPQLGGVAILTGFGVWLAGYLAWSGAPPDKLLLAVLLSAAGLAVVGFIDDRHEIPPISRILMLLVFLDITFALDPELLRPVLHWYSFGDGSIPQIAFFILLSMTSVGLVNSVNMADGQNGLVGSMFVVWSLCLAIVSDGTLAMAAGMVGALSMVFLVFNLQGKIFLGDCGSYGVTFALGILTAAAHARGELPLETIIVWFFIPVADCLRLVVSRPLRGRSLFQGGRDHFHHLLQDALGMRTSAAVYIGAVVASSLFTTLVPSFSLVCLSFMCAFYFSFANLTEAGRDVEHWDEQDTMAKVIPLQSVNDRER